jgi:hypothetical protein
MLRRCVNDCLLLTIAEDKSKWSFTSTVPYALMACIVAASPFIVLSGNIIYCDRHRVLDIAGALTDNRPSDTAGALTGSRPSDTAGAVTDNRPSDTAGAPRSSTALDTAGALRILCSPLPHFSLAFFVL